MTPATILKIFELIKKNFPMREAVEPNAIKTKEKPKVKKIVLTTIKFLFYLMNKLLISYLHPFEMKSCQPFSF